MPDTTFRDNLAEALKSEENQPAGGSEGGIDVFLSYSSKNKNVADAVVAEFEQHGIRCWYAPRDIVPGQEWVSAIHNAITSCSLFVLIYTDSSNESKQVANEVALAFNSGKTLIPFRLSDAEMSSELEYYLTRVHWLDAVNPPLMQSIGNLREYSERILRGDVPKESKIRNVNASGNGRDKKPGWISAALTVLALAAVVAVIVLGIALTDKDEPAGEGGAAATPADTTVTVTNTPAVTSFTQETADRYYAMAYDLQLSGEYEEAYEMYCRARDLQTGDEKIIDAMVDLVSYFYEKSTPEDTQKAFELCRQASACGSVTADNLLGGYYLESDRDKKSDGTARADTNYYGTVISQDLWSAIAFYERSAEKGDAIALYNLGLIFENENDYYTITPLYSRALMYYEKAEQAGHASAAKARERVQEKLRDSGE